MKGIDLTGKIFGKLTVIEFAYTKNKQKFWLCQCECGNKKVISGNSLTTGKTKSCRCLSRGRKKEISKDISGKKFGKLTPIEFAYFDWHNMEYWLCKCDCGKDHIVSVHNLKGGSVLSCGCLAKEKLRAMYDSNRENLIGKKFGFLTVVSHIENSKWACKCDCGNEKLIISDTYSLKSGKTKSCGCFRSHKLKYGRNAFNRIYSSYYCRSIKKNIEFDLTKDEFEVLTKKNCFYCGSEPKQLAKPRERGFGEYVYNGLDRIDNNKGYIKDNVVPCCSQCNIAKNNYTQQEFIDWIKKTYQNLLLLEKENNG